MLEKMYTTELQAESERFSFVPGQIFKTLPAWHML